MLDPVLVIAGRRTTPTRILAGELMEVDVVFELPVGVIPRELSYDRGFLRDKAVYQFR